MKLRSSVESVKSRGLPFFILIYFVDLQNQTYLLSAVVALLWWTHFHTWHFVYHGQVLEKSEAAKKLRGQLHWFPRAAIIKYH